MTPATAQPRRSAPPDGNDDTASRLRWSPDPTADLDWPDPAWPDEPGRGRPPVRRSWSSDLADWWRDRRNDPRLVTGAIALVVLAAGAFWYRSAAAPVASPNPLPTATSVGATTPAAITSATSPTVGSADRTANSTAVERVVVHVAGAVVRPGIVELPTGARIVDALAAAGGPTVRADLDRLNLAAVVVDGERIYVALVGEPPNAGSITSARPSTPGAANTDDTVVNLNTADATLLETLPGIGPTLAAAIIAERERRGGFTAVDDLRAVHGIGPARFADLESRVSV